MICDSRGVRWLLAIAAIAACGGDKRPKQRVVEDAAVPVDALRVTTAAERDALFLAVPTAKAVDDIVARLAAQPHVAGTKANEDVAKEIMRTLGRMGWKLGVADYHVYLPLPRDVAITVEGEPGFEVATVEAANAKYPEAPELLAWMAGSASGTAKAPLVYASHGRAQDLAALKAAGVDVRGKVVLLRTGAASRGAQVAAVERAGAKAVIFYVDPEDEPARPRDSVERGTVAYTWQHPGDPRTPGSAATKDAARTVAEKATALPKIPVVTVTADEAQKLLARLGGRVASSELAGALPGPYKLGPGPTVRVTVELDATTRPVRNLIAIFEGASKDAVVLGSHYDAWGPGAVDPHAGTAALIEIARGLTALRQAGWRPRRTIIVAFWDGGEHGQLGATEWVEEQLAMLRANAVAYFDLGRLARGPLAVDGSPALRAHVRACTGDVTDPTTGKPFAPLFGDLGHDTGATAFLYHAGVASLQWRTTAPYPLAHSLLDDHAAAQATDPGFAFVPAAAQAIGLCAIRLADADDLPLRYSETADHFAALIAAAGKRDRGRLELALASLRDAAVHAEAQRQNPRCNDALRTAERHFLVDSVTPARNGWYRHVAGEPLATERLLTALRGVTRILETGCR